jgi:hypothetical protein
VQFDILNDPIFTTPDAGTAFFVLGHEDVEGGIGMLLRLAPLILLPLVVLQIFLA